MVNKKGKRVETNNGKEIMWVIMFGSFKGNKSVGIRRAVRVLAVEGAT